MNGTELFYEVHGTGHPLVLVHGGNLDHRMWDAQAMEFAKRYRVIRYDVRGFGRSGSWEDPHAAHEDLRALLDRLDVVQAHVVGLSLGGRIALDFALEYPDRVTSLVLASPGLSGFEWSAGGREWSAPLRDAILARDSLRAAALWLAGPYMEPAMQSPTLAAQLRQLAAENSRIWMHRSGEQPLASPAITRLKEIQVPVLLVLGTRDVPDVHRIVNLLATGIPHAQRVGLEGAGHMVNMEREARFNQAVLRFLAAR